MSAVIRSYGDTDFVTGLRAIAVLMVVSIHTEAFRDFGAIGNTITNNGKYGVQIFFVISGFTIARTYRNAPTFKAYFGRRIMRIAPLYALVIVCAFYLIKAGYTEPIYWMTLYGSEADAYNLLMHLTFLSAWDTRIANSILGVEWTIPIEVFWYAVLPLILPVTANRRRMAAVFLGLLVLAVLAKLAEYLFLPKHAAHYLPLSYGAYFYSGAVAESWRKTITSSDVKIRNTIWYGAVGLFVVTLCIKTGLNAALFALATAGLIVARPGTKSLRGVLGATPFLFMGSISYSLYLLHILVIRFLREHTDIAEESKVLFFLIALAVSTIVSLCTYFFIERSTNRLGVRLFGVDKAHKPA